MDTKEKVLLTGALVFLSLGVLFIAEANSSGNLRLIACDVGQGDSQLLITPGGKQILVDGGPGTKVVDCLSQKMPFWDRSIDLVVLTHPQKDHMEGLVEVLARYDVEMIATTDVKADSELFSAWDSAVKGEGAKIYQPSAGNQLLLEQVPSLSLEVLWPTKEKLAEWQVNPPKDLNDTSVVTRLNYGQFCAYLTGDIPKETLETLINKPCQILKIAHHGSKTGTNLEILEKAKPQVALIQSGKNSYGHPTKEVLDMLNSKGVKILRNDMEGIIDIQIDGENLNIN